MSIWKCLTGWEAGFKGDLCNTGKEKISGMSRETKSFLLIFQSPSYFFFNKDLIIYNCCNDIERSALILR